MKNITNRKVIALVTALTLITTPVAVFAAKGHSKGTLEQGRGNHDHISATISQNTNASTFQRFFGDFTNFGLHLGWFNPRNPHNPNKATSSRPFPLNAKVGGDDDSDDATSSPISLLPVINSFTGPYSVTASTTNTWTIETTDLGHTILNYFVNWGDTSTTSSFVTSSLPNITQAVALEHNYMNPGTYTVSVLVKNAFSLTAATSTSVIVTAATSTATST